MPPVVVRFGAGDDHVSTAALRPVIASDDIDATTAGADLLRRGGSAADAAAAVALTLAVTLPSSAGLAARGACLVHDKDTTRLLDFTRDQPGAREAPLVRALLTLHGAGGRLPWAAVVGPAENRARFGTPVSRLLAEQLLHADALVSGGSLAAFLSPQRQLLAQGEVLRQPGLAEALDRVRRLPRPSPDALPWREADTPAFATQGPPAGDDATGFVVQDRDGNAVACALTMGRPFGTGVLRDGLLGAAPETPALAVRMEQERAQVKEARVDAGASNGFRCHLDNALLQCEAWTSGAGYALAVDP